MFPSDWNHRVGLSIRGASGGPAPQSGDNAGMNTFAESSLENVPDAPDDAIDGLARHDDGPSVQPACNPDAETLGLHVSTAVDGFLDGSIEEIDGLIAALLTLRDQVDADARRVRGELSVLARVGHSAMQTTTVLGEALGTWRRVTARGE